MLAYRNIHVVLACAEHLHDMAKLPSCHDDDVVHVCRQCMLIVSVMTL